MFTLLNSTGLGSPRRSRLFALLSVALGLSFWLCAPVLGQQREQRPNDKYQKLYRVEVEDADEAVLIEQELKLKPELVRGRSFYYFGNENINRRLQALGYQPSLEDAENILTRVVRIERKEGEEQLRENGVTIVLRERGYWIARGTIRQLRAMSKAGYAIKELGRGEPYPRQVRVIVSHESDISKVVAPRMDIYSVEKSREGYIVVGGAFDHALDELRDLGFKVEILPDTPGVIR